VSWSPDDRFIALSSFDQTVWIIDVKSGKEVTRLFGHQSTVDDVDWSPDGRTIVSGGNWDQLVILWDAMTYQMLRQIKTSLFVERVAFSPNGEHIAVGQQGILSVFPSTLDINENDLVSYRVIRVGAYAIAWSHSGEYLAFGTQMSTHSYKGIPPSAYIYILNADTSAIIKEFELPWGTIAGIAWNPDDSNIAVYSSNNILTVWDTGTSRILQSMNIDKGVGLYEVGKLDFSRYGGRLAYGVAFDPTVQSRASGDRASIGVSIVVPDASVERLRSIAAMCDAPIAVTDGIATLDAAGAQAFAARIESLPAGTIPPACTADLLAVAEAIAAH
jgi:WD40 repeat protein